MESWVQSWRPRTTAFCDFSSPCLWSIAPATKKWRRVIQSAEPVTQNHLPKTEDLMFQNATLSRKSAPGPPNISDEHVSCTAPFKCPTPATVFGNATKLHVLLIFDKVHNPLRLPRETTSERPKVLRTCQFFALLTGKFPSQGRALFRHVNFQKWSENGVLGTFWLGNVLRATTAWWSEREVFYILTSKRASRHNGVQFFISHLARWLHTRHFSEPTLRPSGATNHWKNTTFRDFSTFSRTCIFFLLALSLLWSYLFFSSLLWLFPPLLFRLSTLSEVWLLNFLRLCRCIYIYILVCNVYVQYLYIYIRYRWNDDNEMGIGESWSIAWTYGPIQVGVWTYICLVWLRNVGTRILIRTLVSYPTTLVGRHTGQPLQVVDWFPVSSGKKGRLG